MRRTYRLNCNRLAISAALVLEVGATNLVNRSLFHDATAHPKSDGATVRISALKWESGAVLAWISRRRSRWHIGRLQRRRQRAPTQSPTSTETSSTALSGMARPSSSGTGTATSF